METKSWQQPLLAASAATSGRGSPFHSLDVAIRLTGTVVKVMIRSRKHFLVLALLTACAGPNRLANLTTADPKASDRYHFFFAKRLMEFDGANALPVGARYERYEKSLNELLGGDPNTTGCKVRSGSINLGEPGSGAVALVSCAKPVPVQVDSSAFTVDGKPFYRYWLKVE